MNPKRPESHAEQHELREKRKELHGKRRQLHERLAEVCEDFVFEGMTNPHKKRALTAELQYLLDYYQDDVNWEGVG